MARSSTVLRFAVPTLFGALVLGAAISAQAAVTNPAYVQCGSAVKGPTGAWDKPFPTIQKALDALALANIANAQVRVKSGICCADKLMTAVSGTPSYPEFSGWGEVYVLAAARFGTSSISGGWAGTARRNSQTGETHLVMDQTQGCGALPRLPNYVFFGSAFTWADGSYAPVQGVTIDRFTIDGFRPAYTNDPAILFGNWYNPPVFPTLPNRLTNLTINAVDPSRVGFGIMTRYAPSEIKYNTIRGPWFGISVNGVYYIPELQKVLPYVVERNTVSGADIGIGINGYAAWGGQPTALVQNNTLLAADGGTGVALSWTAAAVSGNVISGGANALSVDSVITATFTSNQILDPPATPVAGDGGCATTGCGNTWASGAFTICGVDVTLPCQ